MRLKIIPIINKLKKLKNDEILIYSIGITKILIEETKITNKEIKKIIEKSIEKTKEMRSKHGK